MEKTQASLLGLLTKRLGWLSSRQTVISENIANINTAGYVPRDLKPQSFGAALQATANPGSPVTTSAKHLKGTLAGKAPGTMAARGYEAVPTGNSVVMEEQMAKMAETQIDYATMTSLYRKNAGMVRLALGIKQ